MRFSLLFLVMMFSMFNVAKAEELQIGTAAPSFELDDQTGQLRNSDTFLGSWLVLYFYPKDDTPGCTKEACAFRDEYKLLTEENTQVVGISLDSSESHAKFAEKYSLPFPLLADTDGSVARSYQSLVSIGPIKFAKRHSFIIDPDGKIQMIYRNVNPSQHTQQVIADLAKLRSARSINN